MLLSLIGAPYIYLNMQKAAYPVYGFYFTGWDVTTHGNSWTTVC